MSSFTHVVALSAQSSGASGIDRVLHALRTHLSMDVAFISQFRGHDRVFTNVDTDLPGLLQAGDSLPMEAGYCQKVIAGELPQLIPDTSLVPAALEIPETQALPIGAHVSVPVLLGDGRVYGTLCCFSAKPDASLTERDLQMMKVFAELIAERLDAELRRVSERLRKHRHISRVLDGSDLSVVYQPIFNVETGALVGWECLSRFSGEPRRSPDLWFKEAADAGLGTLVEARAIELALQGLDQLPGSAYLALNCSPQMFLCDRLDTLLAPYPAHRLVLEVTEHAIVADYAQLLGAMAPLRARGLRIAIDDAGAGYASLRHILEISPDMIKLDMSLTHGIDENSQRRALASALMAFARETGATVIAEGVERVSELEALRELGADNVQGFLLGRPMPLSAACALAGQQRRPLPDLVHCHAPH